MLARKDEKIGLYVHVPFCASKCPYCDFFSVPSDSASLFDAYADAVVCELMKRLPLLQTHTIKTLYVGGGTPSVLPLRILTKILNNIEDRIVLAKTAERTIEVNPGTLHENDIYALKELGFNRISIGFQSSQDATLKTLGRVHTAKQSIDAVMLARNAGFQNISVDVIFAVPGQTLLDLERDLSDIQKLHVPHVSTYSLTFHQGTVFFDQIHKGLLQPISENLELEMLELIEEKLRATGLRRYEVSNFASPSFEAKHNMLYWTGNRYVGLGPSAHSFWHQNWKQGHRWQGVRNLQAYVTGNAQQTSHAEIPSKQDSTIEFVEELNSFQMMTERMCCGLRLTTGLCLDETVFQMHSEHVQQGIAKAVEQKLAMLKDQWLIPTEKGIRYQDDLAALFF